MRIISNKNINLYIKLHNIKINTCPYCNSNKFVKYGKYHGLQRYMCKNENCSKTFTLKSKTTWSYSKKEYKDWKKYIELMIEGLSLRQCATQLKISLTTAFYWRRKILNMLLNTEKTGLLCETVDIHKFIVKENFKGEKKLNFNIKKNINVVTAIDKSLNTLCKAVSNNYLNITTVKEKIFSKIDIKAFVKDCPDRIIKLQARIHNEKNNTLEKSLQNKESNYLNTAVKFNMSMKIWFRKFNGIATKYLNTYLFWYININKCLKEDIYIDNIMTIRSFKKCNKFIETNLFEE